MPNMESFILNVEPGRVFDINDIIKSYKNNTVSRNYITVVLSKLYKEKKVSKTINGKYYIPKKGIILPLPVSKEEDIIQRYITNGNSIYGVFSGYRVLNKWGLSQQYAAQKEVVTNNVNIRNYDMKKLNAKIRKAKFKITKQNYQIAELFEVLKTYDKLNTNENINKIEMQIAKYINNNFTNREKVELAYYLYNYESKATENRFMKIHDYLDEIVKTTIDIYREDQNETT